MVLPRLGPANGCWPGKEHPVITICTDLRLPEAFETLKVRLKNQKIKNQSFSAVVVLIHKAKGCVRRQRPVSELIPKGAKKTACGP